MTARLAFGPGQRRRTGHRAPGPDHARGRRPPRSAPPRVRGRARRPRPGTHRSGRSPTRSRRARQAPRPRCQRAAQRRLQRQRRRLEVVGEQRADLRPDPRTAARTSAVLSAGSPRPRPIAGRRPRPAAGRTWRIPGPWTALRGRTPAPSDRSRRRARRQLLARGPGRRRSRPGARTGRRCPAAAASSARSRDDRPVCQSSLQATSVAAASALPPARPAATGIRLRISIRTAAPRCAGGLGQRAGGLPGEIRPAGGYRRGVLTGHRDGGPVRGPTVTSSNSDTAWKTVTRE